VALFTNYFPFFVLGPPLLLPSLRLFIPPLRLVSAAMWQVVQRGDVQDYGMLEEFVTMVTEIVPELLSCSQRAQLILGLRARVRDWVQNGENKHATQSLRLVSDNNIVDSSINHPAVKHWLR
jgi:hypothetical protein